MDINNGTLVINSKTISLIGTIVFNVSINLWIISQYGGTSELGKVLAVSGFTTILFNLIGGYIGDIWSKDKILKYADLLSGIICILSVVLFKNVTLFTLTTIIVLININNSITSPIVRAFIPYIVDKNSIVKYNSRLSLLREIAGIVVPLITTYLFNLKLLNIDTVILVNGLSFIISFLLVNMIKMPKTNITVNKKNIGNSNFKRVFTYLWAENIVTILLIPSLLSNIIIAGFNLALPAYSIKVLSHKEYYGVFLGVESVGALIGIISAKFYTIDNSMFKERMGLFLTGLFLWIPFILQSKLLICVVCFCFSFFISRYNIAFQSYVQINTPKNILGKTFSIVFSIAGIAAPLGSLIFGYIGDIIVKEIFIIISLGLIFINGIWIWYVKLYLKMPKVTKNSTNF